MTLEDMVDRTLHHLECGKPKQIEFDEPIGSRCRTFWPSAFGAWRTPPELIRGILLSRSSAITTTSMSRAWANLTYQTLNVCLDCWMLGEILPQCWRKLHRPLAMLVRILSFDTMFLFGCGVASRIMIDVTVLTSVKGILYSLEMSLIRDLAVVYSIQR